MHPLNQQAPEKPVNRGDGVLEIIGSPFYTIQGEGPFAGMPAVFVRLAGCNLQCPACDTEYTRDRVEVDPSQLRELVCKAYMADRVSLHPPVVVITGGEPFRQVIGPAVRELNAAGFMVQIETNGTLYQEDMPWFGALLLVCSPKAGQIHPNLHPYIHHLKYVLQDGWVDGTDGLPVNTLGNTGSVARPWQGFFIRGTIWVQPLDEQDPCRNSSNMQAAVRSAMRFGYRLSVQTHKVAGVP